MTKIAEYGTWDSPITTELFEKCNCKQICELSVVNGVVYWVEQNAMSGKRELYSEKDGKRERWADGYSVQTNVHEYGGGAHHVLKDGSVIFATVNGLFYQKSSDSPVDQIANGADRKLRFADCSTNDTHIFCVNENHQGNSKHPENRLISIDRKTKKQEVIASGADFYAYPRISPNGDKLIFMEWNHINMPWDETSIRMADIDKDGRSSGEVVIKDGTGKNINYCEPSWLSNEKLYMINDSTNWWNVYQVDVVAPFKETNMNPIMKECGYPLWQLGFRNYAANDQCLAMAVDGKIHYCHGESTTVIDIPGYTVLSYLSIEQGSDVLYMIASGPKKASSVIGIELNNPTKPPTVIRESRDSSEIDQLEISVPEEITFKSDGIDVSGFFYPPLNSSYSPPPGTLPPVLLLGHSGPTAPAQSSLDFRKQFFTSRGVAVFDVNYRGSTGFGTDFRRMLYKQCGVVDRDDMLNGAQALIEQGRVDKDKVVIRGSSAGGCLLLNCLISKNNIIKAAVSLYGVADLLALDEDTHKLEQYYNENLYGKYPEEAALYDERSPVNHIDKINTPIAFIHGKEDTVVPMQQSITMYEKIRARGVTTALMLFDNEGHGFRSGEVIKKSTEATFYFLMKAIGIEPSIQSEDVVVTDQHVKGIQIRTLFKILDIHREMLVRY